MSMTKIQKELLGALIGLARSVEEEKQQKVNRRSFPAVTAMVTARTKPRMRFCLAEFVRQIRKKS